MGIQAKQRCIYCGTEIAWEDSNNPSDEGLHNIVDKYSENGSVCCGPCNVITSVNRNFKRMIEEPELFNVCVYHIEEDIKYLKNNRDMYIKHYIQAKQRR